MTQLVEIERFSLEYVLARTRERFVAIGDVTLSIERGSFTVIVGPSGCGKSSLLKAIAGLLRGTSGKLLISGNPIAGPGNDRAFVFQAPALLPWRDVLGNVLYGLTLRGLRKVQALARAREMIDLVGLSPFVHRYPHELSGGMKQRVNLARALAVDPDILLLDEPFSALDTQTRETMQAELLRIWSETSSKTAIFVTHDISEAVFLADQVAILSPGPSSTLIETVPVPLGRPRTQQTRRETAFFDLVDYISARIGKNEGT